MLALRPIGNSPVFVTAHGVGYLDLRTMTASDRTCVGLNNSQIVAAAFDVTVASRLHALTADGDLLTLALVRCVQCGRSSLSTRTVHLSPVRASPVSSCGRCKERAARTGNGLRNGRDDSPSGHIP